MIVEVDPETMRSRSKYVVVHDCGTVINPLILEGQIHGGVAQGIGNAFYEQLVFDAQGQLLNASLADYLLPTALDVPRMELAHTVTPSPLNPLGIKGAGEAGAIPVGALFAQASRMRCSCRQGVELLEIPLSPSRLWELAAGRILDPAPTAGGASSGREYRTNPKERHPWQPSAPVSGYLPNDRPRPGRLILLGLQHVVTMFPATVFVALLCGFHPSTVLLGAGISTIVALILSRQGIGTFIPLFYGSSFSYIASYLGIAKAMGVEVKFGVPAPDAVISMLQAGIIATGILNIIVGFIIKIAGKPRARSRAAAGGHRLGRLRHRARPVEGGARHVVLRRPVPTGASRSSPWSRRSAARICCRARASSACCRCCSAPSSATC